MTILAVIGEDADFDRIGVANLTVAPNTSTSNKRSTARHSFDCYVSSGGANLQTSYGKVDLPAPITSAWLTMRFISSLASSTLSCMLLGFGKSSSRRIGLVGSGVANKMSIGKIDAAGTTTILATESGTFSTGVLNKYDMQIINFGVTGTVNVYRSNADGTARALIITYTGDLTTNAITNLDSVVFQGINTSGSAYYSEIICSSTDTTGMGLVTLEPTANGNTYAWSGSFTDVSESTLNDATLISSVTTGQIAQFAFNSARMGTPPYIEALAIVARGQAGGGVTNFTPNIRIAATDYFGTPVAPGTGLKPVLGLFALNPNTGLNFTFSQLTAVGVNYGFRANT